MFRFDSTQIVSNFRLIVSIAIIIRNEGKLPILQSVISKSGFDAVLGAGINVGFNKIAGCSLIVSRKMSSFSISKQIIIPVFPKGVLKTPT